MAMIFTRKLSTSQAVYNKHFKLLVCGGGAGGSSVSHKFSKKIGGDNVGIIEPSDDHYFQPMWTLVGAGAKTLDQSRRNMKDILPKNANWIKQTVSEINPDKNSVTTADGETVTYDYLVVAMGLKTNYDLIPGLESALQNCPSVCSNYSSRYVKKTFEAFQNFRGGNAIFTFPNTPIKCPGAPQKIMYLFHDYCKKNNLRDKANIIFNTSLPVIFGVKKYADELLKVCAKRDLQINFRHNLIKVDHENKLAEFENLDTGDKKTLEFSFLHVTPPMGPLDVIKKSNLSDETGWITVQKESMQHTKYKNVFALGDNTNVPTSKTAAAVAEQAETVFQNLGSLMDGKSANSYQYNGYTSCPLITSYSTCIMAEFDYTLTPVETFPIDQGKERYSMFQMKSHFMPQLYWHGLTQGIWNGPRVLRKVLRAGF